MSKIKPLLVLIFTLGIVIIAIWAIVKMRTRECETIQVQIHYEGQYPTVSQADVIALIKHSGMDIMGKKLKEINFGELSSAIAKNPFILRTNKIYFQKKTAIIDISLKKLLLHVYPQNGEQYYVDINGDFLPYSPNVKENLIVANGFIKTQYTPGRQLPDKSTVKSLFNIAKLIEEDTFYSAQFRQLYVNEKNDIEIIPAVGKQIIIFGDEENAAEKLFNLKETYKNGLTYIGLDQYAQLDVRFKNRVIAKKR